MDLEQACVSVWNDFPQPDPEVQQLAVALKELASLTLDVAGTLVESLLTMDFDKLAKLGGKFREMFLMSPEIFDALWDENWASKDSFDKGYITGRATAEIGAMFLPWAKAARGLNNVAKLSKAKFLEDLPLKSKYFDTGPGRAAMDKVRASHLPDALATTKACFPAGTPVLTKQGLRPIEKVHRGDLVLARSEDGTRQDWRPVVDTITTHPDTLYHLRLRVETRGERFAHRARDGVDGGDADPALPAWSAPGTEETLTTTGNHPFYVLSRPQPGFLPAEELRPGDRLSLADGGTATLSSFVFQTAAPGTRFRTYNLEVAEHHTYFVGREAVWVHNSSGAWCGQLASLLLNITKQRQLDVWQAFTYLQTNWGRKLAQRLPSRWQTRLHVDLRKHHFGDGPNFPASPGANPPWRNLGNQPNRPVGPGYNARNPDLLAKNMEAAYGYPHPGREFTAHHITPKRYAGDPSVPDSMALHSRDANDVLDHYGISPEEACSGMYLPNRHAVDAEIELDGYGPLHSPLPPGGDGIHNKDYLRELATRLKDLKNNGASADDVRDELQKIALQISKKIFPGTNF